MLGFLRADDDEIYPLPGADADHTGDAVQIVGGKSDAELLIKLQNFSTTQ